MSENRHDFSSQPSMDPRSFDQPSFGPQSSGSGAPHLDANNLLEVQGLEVGFLLRGRMAKAIHHLNLTLKRGETLGLVGESGCGKSVTSLAIMRLIPEPGQILGGKIMFQGEDLLQKSKSQIRGIRGNRIAMIFQDPMTALNPVFTIGDQLVEPILLHKKISKAEALDRAEALLVEVGLPHPNQQLNRYPHELSGGQRQRVVIAMALSCEPDLLIADEPTTALDVTIQAQILELMAALQEKYHTGILLITHDLGVIAETADRVAIMYAGDIVEMSDVQTLFDASRHPYTQGLMASMPSLDTNLSTHHRLFNIPGRVPSLLEMPSGCRFQNRCMLADEECSQDYPGLYSSDEQESTHVWRCIKV